MLMSKFFIREFHKKFLYFDKKIYWLIVHTYVITCTSHKEIRNNVSGIVRIFP